MNLYRCHALLFGVLWLAACGNGDLPGSGRPEDLLSLPGPALRVTPADLDAALVCTDDLADAAQDPVLITPAFSTANESFGGYIRQLPTLGIPTCSITLPDHGFDDLQNAAEYVVLAVRRIHAISGRKIILFGHQHGPLDELWALTFWPDLPGKVSSLIALATPFQGTVAATGFCNVMMNCSPSVWQIAAGSDFITTLLARPLPPGVAITSISTNNDEVILPQPAASGREGITQIVLQDICPMSMSEHFTILSDNLTYELFLDAYAHPGQPANPANLPADICSGPRAMPAPAGGGEEESANSGGDGFFVEFPTNNLVNGVSAEPPLRDYALRP